MTRPPKPGSQVMDLFLHIAEAMGFQSDKEIADLAGVTPENVSNWRQGQSKEFKAQTLEAIKETLSARLATLREFAGTGTGSPGINRVEIEEGSGPADLQRQFQERVAYDYLGHRFLYYEPHGALAWEKLIRAGYDQETWLRGVDQCAAAWLESGPLVQALGLDKRARARGLDMICLGSGDAQKENRVLATLFQVLDDTAQRLPWLTFAPVDVSIPLVLSAEAGARRTLDARTRPAADAVGVLAFCADFEEGSLGFLQRLPTSKTAAGQGVRLVTLLGNTFGNLRDEESFVRQKLWAIARPKDFVWLEVGVKPPQIESDPLFPLTQPNRAETSGEANRRILLEGPYRRYEAAMGRRPVDTEMRVWIRSDDESSRVPGSVNFCHDLLLKDDRRVTTMLYSRRYEIEGLTRWLEGLQFTVERISKVDDSKGKTRVVHLLLRRV
jgi:hypothetical protein